eukprot:CAMPEP_0169119548 /NCGR_PEP_ID=MMETSP1015-20121227/31620_1 /TAXON_ID=342587 /ORGANISM="Karlodinium micrum, Strain CCMP2283" /LENGTH=38 /DNA_ID= /DNA_START= /DNA_END= /DNA_ORIENTATION=
MIMISRRAPEGNNQLQCIMSDYTISLPEVRRASKRVNA